MSYSSEKIFHKYLHDYGSMDSRVVKARPSERLWGCGIVGAGGHCGPSIGCRDVRFSVSAGGAVLSLVSDYLTVPFGFIHYLEISLRFLICLHARKQATNKRNHVGYCILFMQS